MPGASRARSTRRTSCRRSWTSRRFTPATCRAAGRSRNRRLLHARAREHRGGTGRARGEPGERRAARRAFYPAYRPRGDDRRCLAHRALDLPGGRAAAGHGPRGVSRRLPAGPRADLETGVYYTLALASIEEGLAALGVNRVNAGPRDERFTPLTDPAATIVDAWRIARSIYQADELPPVMDLEAFHAGYLPGRGPNSKPASTTRSRSRASRRDWPRSG